MNLSHSEIKDFAVAKLGNNKWGEAIGVAVIFLIISSVASFIPFIGTIASLIIGGPMALGMATYFIKLNRNQGATLNDMFSGFQNFGNAFLLALLSLFIIVGTVIIAMIPIALILFMGYGGQIKDIMTSYSPGELPNVSLGIIMVLLLATLLLFIPILIISISLSQAYRIMHDNPRISAMGALRKSWELMKGRKMDYFLFNFGFIGWYLLAMLTCGLGLVVLYPYVLACNAKYYDEITGGGQQEIDSIGENLGKL